MEPELFDAPISVSDSRLSLNCDCKRGRINEVTMMDEIGDSLNQRKKMEPELFDVPISVSDSRLSLNCDCRRRRINEVTIMDLLAAIMVEILTKLPINMIFRYYDYTSQRINRPIILDRNLHLPHPADLVSEDKANLTLIGSCNGFICLLNGETHVVNRSVCISNPLLDVTELEVYTLGVDERNWRNVGKAPKPVRGKLSNATVNGTTHWLDGENFQNRASIYSFNIATEEVKSLLAPSGLKSPSLYSMLAVTELGNCLCLSTPQHPTRIKLRTQNNRVLRKARRLTTDSGVLSWINDVQDADPGYLCLHRHKMQANWHQYIECTSMRAGKLNHNLSLKRVQENTYLGSVQLINN
ncbi:hypothetical protein MTR67_022011 [Solanum verrucosum]|uniref:Uncharacterized protein n=1 Tax=Solanum verrucosum TaxID=315347 RepID=A0AAF0TQE1_SOLVR|nr:hypothetical protein MTR67_022011 [Solanum verrucosum]